MLSLLSKLHNLTLTPVGLKLRGPIVSQQLGFSKIKFGLGSTPHFCSFSKYSSRGSRNEHRALTDPDEGEDEDELFSSTGRRGGGGL